MGAELDRALPACLLAGSSSAVPLLNNVRKSWNTRAARVAGQLAEELGSLVCRYRCNGRLSLEAEAKAHWLLHALNHSTIGENFAKVKINKLDFGGF